jgi:hypothetical protein
LTIIGLVSQEESLLHQQERPVSPSSELRRVTEFYEAFFPSKVKDLPAAFQQFVGKEREMKNKVITKYIDRARSFFTPGS